MRTTRTRIGLECRQLGNGLSRTFERRVMAMKLGERIRSLREERGLTAGDFASQLGVTAHDVLQVESGDRQLSHQELTHIATALDVPVDYFFQSDSTPEPVAAAPDDGESLLIPAAQLSALLDKMKK